MARYGIDPGWPGGLPRVGGEPEVGRPEQHGLADGVHGGRGDIRRVHLHPRNSDAASALKRTRGHGARLMRAGREAAPPQGSSEPGTGRHLFADRREGMHEGRAGSPVDAADEAVQDALVHVAPARNHHGTQARSGGRRRPRRLQNGQGRDGRTYKRWVTGAHTVLRTSPGPLREREGPPLEHVLRKAGDGGRGGQRGSRGHGEGRQQVHQSHVAQQAARQLAAHRRTTRDD